MLLGSHRLEVLESSHLIVDIFNAIAFMGEVPVHKGIKVLILVQIYDDMNFGIFLWYIGRWLQMDKVTIPRILCFIQTVLCLLQVESNWLEEIIGLNVGFLDT